MVRAGNIEVVRQDMLVEPIKPKKSRKVVPEQELGCPYQSISTSSNYSPLSSLDTMKQQPCTAEQTAATTPVDTKPIVLRDTVGKDTSEMPQHQPVSNTPNDGSKSKTPIFDTLKTLFKLKF